MNLITFIFRHLLYLSFFLVTLSGVAQAETKGAFTINGKTVPQTVATVNGTKLTSDLLKREMIAYRLLSNRQGKDIETVDEEKIAQRLLMKAIDDELVYQQGLKQNINIDPAIIDRELNHIKTQFPDKKLFLAALAAQRLTFDVLKQNITKALVKDEFVRTNIAPQVQVNDDKVQSFYQKNKATFMNPETFKVSHIYVAIPGPDDGKAELTEDRAKAKEIIDWVTNEARKKINQASLSLKEGKSFQSVAKEFSEDPKTSEKGGDLGFLMKNQTLPEISRVMVKLMVGETSNIIESSLGFHIIQLTEKKERNSIALDEVKSEILNHLLKLETEKKLKDHLSSLRKNSQIKIFI
ncbi:MAG: hypothetical protein HOB32_09950 [Nitrospina sp.]|jgi:peptidyl-prolyl cis-trans isomerase C|nr:hypothetical protein [Nitrospina sp.]MBT6601955.1 hypothetical protein [Nitrospina sp.]